MAQIESNWDEKATNKGSGAKGLFQFLSATASEEALSDPYDVSEAAAVVAERVRRDCRWLEQKGLQVSLLSAYLCHQQGRKGLAEIYACSKGESSIPLSLQRLTNLRSNLPGLARAAFDGAKTDREKCNGFLEYWLERLEKVHASL